MCIVNQVICYKFLIREMGSVQLTCDTTIPIFIHTLHCTAFCTSGLTLTAFCCLCTSTVHNDNKVEWNLNLSNLIYYVDGKEPLNVWRQPLKSLKHGVHVLWTCLWRCILLKTLVTAKPSLLLQHLTAKWARSKTSNNTKAALCAASAGKKMATDSSLSWWIISLTHTPTPISQRTEIHPQIKVKFSPKCNLVFFVNVYPHTLYTDMSIPEYVWAAMMTGRSSC